MLDSNNQPIPVMTSDDQGNVHLADPVLEQFAEIYATALAELPSKGDYGKAQIQQYEQISQTLNENRNHLAQPDRPSFDTEHLYQDGEREDK